MAVKWRSKAGPVGPEPEVTAERIGTENTLLLRGSEWMMRFLLGAVLSGGTLFGGYAPFGVGFVACSGPGSDGLCALLGACWGYLLFHGFSQGLRCAAACVLVFSVSFAFYDVGLCRRSWFMPLTAAAMDAVTGFVYLSDAAWGSERITFFATEIILAGASAYFYQTAFSLWRRKEERLTHRQKVSLFFLLGSLLVALAGVSFLGGLSLGRIAAVMLVMAAARTGGATLGAAAGVTAGLGMDLAAGGMPFYAMAYGFSGLLTGAGRRQGRLFAVLSYGVSNAVAVLWSWEVQPRISGLYEVFIASVLFLLIPQRWLKALSGFLTARQSSEAGERAAAEYARKKLEDTAEAFRRLRSSLRAAFPADAPNDADPSCVFDRAAERVCRRCALRGTCWEHDYISTFNALNDALPAMMERGKGEGEDFPVWFTGRCLQFSAFLRAANEELTALRYRRQYQNRVRESRGAVCRQYETLANVLTETAAEFSARLTPDPVREKRLARHLAALGIEGEAAAYYDHAGHLRLEAAGEGVERLRTPQEVRGLSQVMGLPLRAEEGSEHRTVLVQSEPLMAMAALAARRREGQSESGDTGTWFKRADGSLFVLLCDGMGSGKAAHGESGLAVRLLEDFLRAGMEAQAALRTVNSALALKNEENGAFTTVDLLRLDLFTGTGEVCKLGAAPTYIRKKGAVSRLTGSALPAGLADGEGVGPDVTALELEPGDWVVLLSDGVSDGTDDGWVRELLEQFDGESPKELAGRVMEESEKRVGAADDRTAVVIGLRCREKLRESDCR